MLTFTIFAGYAGRFWESSNICLSIHFGCLRDRENLLNGIINQWNKSIFFAFAAVLIRGNSNNLYIHSVHLGQLHTTPKYPRRTENISPLKELDSSCLKIVGYGRYYVDIKVSPTKSNIYPQIIILQNHWSWHICTVSRHFLSNWEKNLIT